MNIFLKSKHCLLSFVLSLLVYNSWGQYVYRGIVVGDDKKYIPYATVTDLNKKHGVVSDSVGRFIFYSSSKLDSLVFSAQGYLSCVSSVFQNKDIVVSLINNGITLPESIVKNQKKQTRIVGFSDRKAVGSHKNCFSTNLEISLLINSKELTNSCLTQVAVYITKEGSYTRPFRLQIYEDENGKPGKSILHKNIVIMPQRPSGWVIINLQQDNIYIPDHKDFHIAIEWLYSDDLVQEADKCFGIALGIAQVGSTVLANTRINGGLWSKCDFYKLPNGKIFNPMIQAVIETYN